MYSPSLHPLWLKLLTCWIGSLPLTWSVTLQPPWWLGLVPRSVHPQDVPLRDLLWEKKYTGFYLELHFWSLVCWNHSGSLIVVSSHRIILGQNLCATLYWIVVEIGPGEGVTTPEGTKKGINTMLWAAVNSLKSNVYKPAISLINLDSSHQRQNCLFRTCMDHVRTSHLETQFTSVYTSHT